MRTVLAALAACAMTAPGMVAGAAPSGAGGERAGSGPVRAASRHDPVSAAPRRPTASGAQKSVRKIYRPRRKGR